MSARLRAAGDPRAAFTDVYAIITRRVCEALHGEGAPVFEAPHFISRLAGQFCGLYLAALARSVEGEPEPVTAWAVADRWTRSGRALPAQHALLGLNAHINHDLAHALAVNIATLGVCDASAMAHYRHDHDAVNELLLAAMPEVLELLSVRYGCPLATRLLEIRATVRRAACRATLLALQAWRSRAWDDLLALRAARAERGGQIERRMNRRAGLFACLFAFPWPLPHGHQGNPP